MTATGHSETGGHSSPSFSEQSDAALFVPSTRSQMLLEPQPESAPSVVGSSFDLIHSESTAHISDPGKRPVGDKHSSNGVIENGAVMDYMPLKSTSKAGSSDQSLKGVFDGSLPIMQGSSIFSSSSNTSSSQINISSPHHSGTVTADNDGGFILPSQLPQTMFSNSAEPRPATVERGQRGGRGGYGTQSSRGQPQYHNQNHRGNPTRGFHDYNNWSRRRGRGAGHNVNGNGNWLQNQGFVPMWPNIPYSHNPSFVQHNPYMQMQTYGACSYMGHPYQDYASQFVYVLVSPPIPSPPYLSAQMPQHNMPLQNDEELTKLKTRIMNQIDYYFSDANLVTDIYLRKRMDPQGWVPIETIASFRMINLMTDNIDMILNAVRSSKLVEVQGNKIRRRKDFEKWPILDG